MSLSASQKSIIKASIPFLEKNGVELTSNFYSFMLENHPEVRPFFNKAHQISKAQPKILAFSLNAYAKNIDDITPLKGFVRQIVEKHVGLQVKPQHYDIVGSCLLQTMKKMLGDAATDEFIEAWKVAYYDLANILIQLEKERYAEELQQLKNSWPGFADAHVDKIVQETPLIKSVYFKLDDEKATISDFYPGQYIGLRLSTDGGETFQSREYSISNELEGPSSIKSSNSFRISVKRIEGGVVSNYIHDTLKVGDKLRITSPFGKLTEPWLKSTDETERAKPVNVFVGGIGITPNVSITEHFLKMGNPVKLFLSNADINSRVFGQWVSRISEQYPKQLQVKEFITEPAATDLQTSANHQIHYGRRLEQQDLDFITKENVNDFQYFMVGPVPYMQFLHEILGSKGVNPNVINSEEFAPVHV
ncbi:hypothetical protein WICPIJ_008826 [Wickerhamomyces pijperi]|uniref:nitric oxide dioxygenase n=1 Tax=Wickerhamomyces pijperi TaxID=599730 RepID=A0A9P8THD1_WICPI|nr:hypothetical protein WICPIJ_008826 [Wickerhamomyces pijperi]